MPSIDLERRSIPLQNLQLLHVRPKRIFLEIMMILLSRHLRPWIGFASRPKGLDSLYRLAAINRRIDYRVEFLRLGIEDRQKGEGVGVVVRVGVFGNSAGRQFRGFRINFNPLASRTSRACRESAWAYCQMYPCRTIISCCSRGESLTGQGSATTIAPFGSCSFFTTSTNNGSFNNKASRSVISSASSGA